MSNPALARLVPVLFVFLWSTGWICGRAVAPYAEPLSFLVVRFSCAAAALLAVVLYTGAPWPRSRSLVGHSIIVGVMLHGIYLAAVWYAIRHGLPAGVSGVIAAVQPILTAALAPTLLGESIGVLQRIGIAVGFAGIGLVLWPKLASVSVEEISTLSAVITINVIGMLAVTFATFYQKRFLTGVDLRTSTVLQYVGALLLVAPLALWLESFHLEWNATTLATLAWSVLALSIGAIMLYLVMIERGEVSRIATLIYLVPAAVALEALLLFGERLQPVQILGMLLTVAGVALAVHRASA